MYLIEYSKSLDEWIDSNIQSLDVPNSGVLNCIEASEVEQKMALLVDALSDAVSALKIIEEQKNYAFGPLYGIAFDRVYIKAKAAGVER